MTWTPAEIRSSSRGAGLWKSKVGQIFIHFHFFFWSILTYYWLWHWGLYSGFPPHSFFANRPVFCSPSCKWSDPSGGAESSSVPKDEITISMNWCTQTLDIKVLTNSESWGDVCWRLSESRLTSRQNTIVSAFGIWTRDSIAIMSCLAQGPGQHIEDAEGLKAPGSW